MCGDVAAKEAAGDQCASGKHGEPRPFHVDSDRRVTLPLSGTPGSRMLGPGIERSQVV
jgi:hypothetical protein